MEPERIRALRAQLTTEQRRARMACIRALFAAAGPKNRELAREYIAESEWQEGLAYFAGETGLTVEECLADFRLYLQASPEAQQHWEPC